ncbi:hypothetical protein PKCBPO_03949 [Methylorubrum thiocyanatum]
MRRTGAECRDTHATATPVLALGQGSAMTWTVYAMGKAPVQLEHRRAPQPFGSGHFVQ